MLGFEAEPAMAEVIAGVELHAGLSGANRHDASGFRIFDAGGFDQRFSAVINYEVMVVAI